MFWWSGVSWRLIRMWSGVGDDGPGTPLDNAAVEMTRQNQILQNRGNVKICTNTHQMHLQSQCHPSNSYKLGLNSISRVQRCTACSVQSRLCKVGHLWQLLKLMPTLSAFPCQIGLIKILSNSLPRPLPADVTAVGRLSCISPSREQEMVQLLVVRSRELHHRRSAQHHQRNNTASCPLLSCLVFPTDLDIWYSLYQQANTKPSHRCSCSMEEFPHSSWPAGECF